MDHGCDEYCMEKQITQIMSYHKDSGKINNSTCGRNVCSRVDADL